MRLWIVGSFVRMASLGFAWGGVLSLSAARPPGDAPRIEEGLVEAVEWKWDVAPPGTDEWGMPLPEAKAAADEADPAEVQHPATYEVRKGDAIIKIARKFHMSAAQLMQYNGLKSDLIQIGQILKIPTREELLAMVPPPVAEPVAGEGKDAGKPAGRPGLELPPTTVAELELQTVLLQVFLDREMFSPGPIDGALGPMFQQTRDLYMLAHQSIGNNEQLKAKALAAVDSTYTSYTLRAEDFRFIKLGKDAPVGPRAGTLIVNRKKKAEPDAVAPPVASVRYEDLAAADFLAYRSVWEFVAERFHCDEAFLRRINPHIDVTPIVGTVFQVPNVIPFEIENALDPPLQPAVIPWKTVTATVVGLSRLEITRGGRVIAIMPVATARPGLKGRGTWTILDAVPRPRMVTRREPREAPDKPSDEAQEPAEFLAPGPNNPVGVVWIHLAKANSTEPLRYGLHGTSIPERMKLEGIGGFRLSNWDIARAVRLLPAGTPLQWKER